MCIYIKFLLSLEFLKEIIVVNDASYDGSANILNKNEITILIHHKKNMVKKSTLGTGIRLASGNIILIQDADFEYNPDDYKKLIQPFIKLMQMLSMEQDLKMENTRGYIFLALCCK